MVKGKRESRSKGNRIIEGAIASEELQGGFPRFDLPIQPPFPPMEAKLVSEIPTGEGWSYEPKWDGFRCLAFRSGNTVALQSKAGQPLGRYFPELVEVFRELPVTNFVLDGEIVIVREGQLSFDDLLLRIHPAESRIRKLSTETPATYLAFDLLVDDISMALQKGKRESPPSLLDAPLEQRRARLESLFRHLGRELSPGHKGAPKHDWNARLRLSPASEDRLQAQSWMRDLAIMGLDGIVAKRLDAPYASGERSMQKVKRMRTADCVVGGFRYASKGGEVGSLLLGLYDEDGRLNHVGFTSSFAREQRKQLRPVLKPFMDGSGFSGRAPGGPSRWSTERSGQWEPLEPKLVCEVQYDHFSGDRFRHGTKFLRWRPDKDPRECNFEQVRPSRSAEWNVRDLLGAA